MRETILSRRYAEALADVAEKDGTLRKVLSELTALAGAATTSSGFQALIRTARKSREEKKAVFRQICEELNLSGNTRRMLEYLVEKRRTGLLPHLAESFAEEAHRRLGVQKGVLITATPLTEQQRTRLLEKLEQITGAKMEMEETVDESLIAGFQVRLEGKFFDGSLQGRLEKTKERMAHGR